MQYFYNATFFTPGGQAQAILVNSNGLIEQVFELAPATSPAGAKAINLNGAFVLPGFIDTHTHSFEGGLYSLGCDLHGCTSIAMVLERFAATKPVGGMVFGFGLDELELTEQRLPLKSELDRLFAKLPAVIRRVDGHSCVLNSAGLRLAGIQSDTGLLRGEQNDTAVHSFHKAVDENGIFAAYHKAAQIAIASGHTTIHTMVGDAGYDPRHFALLQQNLHKFKVEFIPYPQILDPDKAAQLGATKVGGCILADGSFGSHTAGLKQPYADQPANYGRLYQTQDFWNSFFARAHQLGLQACVHTIGDAATEQIITAIEHAQKQTRKDIRHEIIHGELMSPDMPQRIADAGAACVMQPVFDRLWGGDGFYKNVLGTQRALLTNRLASLWQAGVLVTGSSDWYVTPLSAIDGIYAAQNMHNPSYSLNRGQAISLYTTNAAKLSSDENRLGAIKVGANADLCLLNVNPYTISDIRTAKITGVYKGGTKVSS